MTKPKSDSRISEFIEANRELEATNICKSVGKDTDGVHYYLFFGHLYIELPDEKRHQIREYIGSLVQFIAQRKR